MSKIALTLPKVLVIGKYLYVHKSMASEMTSLIALCNQDRLVWCKVYDGNEGRIFMPPVVK